MLTNLIQLCLSLPQPLSASFVTSLTTLLSGCMGKESQKQQQQKPPQTFLEI